MSMNNLTIDGEFRYIVQWFNEWSELQRDDFVPILVQFIAGSHISDNDDNDEVTATTTPVNMNGLPNDLEFNGRPMSLFQCRIKLFNQWNRRWPTEFKVKLQQKISEIDGKVGEKINLALNPNYLGSLTNGNASNEEHQNDVEQLKENAENFVNVPGAEAMILNDAMTEVLNNETSVDDIETHDNINSINEQPLSNIPLHAADGIVNNDKVCSTNTRHNRGINEQGEPVLQVVQMQNLQIDEENAEKDNNDVTATMEQEQQQQQQVPSVTVTVNPAVVTQTITANAEVPLVI